MVQAEGGYLPCMLVDEKAKYAALKARDRRFDGVFFVGVLSTGIYCRPVCTAKTPGRAQCRFFASAAGAEREGFRPCLKCRPELAPGLDPALAPGVAPIDGSARAARAAARMIERGALDGGSVAGLAAEMGLSDRHLRRLVQTWCGATPVELAQTRRLLLAKQLLTETRMPIGEVARASGFLSVRRFNHLFLERYRMAPTRFRARAEPGDGKATELCLAYRPPLAWEAMLEFLAGRAISGVEEVREETYARTVAVGTRVGCVRVRRDERGPMLRVSMDETLLPVAGEILARLREMFDLDARPDVIAEHLLSSTDACEALRTSVREMPGLRVPGCFEKFELLWRCVVGQQVSVKAASTIAGRLAERFGEKLEGEGLTRLTPTAEGMARSRPGEIEALGVPAARAGAVRAIARFVAEGGLCRGVLLDPAEGIRRLRELPGIGPWTASYAAMRALRWPDAFPAGDLVLRKAAGNVGERELEAMSAAWRPWRAYAAMHLWRAAARKRRTGDVAAA